MSNLDLLRSHDPARGAFCETDKNGKPMPLPPTVQDPQVRHIDKTRQDRTPVGERPRVNEAQARLAKMQG